MNQFCSLKNLNTHFFYVVYTSLTNWKKNNVVFFILRKSNIKIYPSNSVRSNFKPLYTVLICTQLSLILPNAYYGIFAAFANCKALGADFVAVAECISCDAPLLLNKFVTVAKCTVYGAKDADC